MAHKIHPLSPAQGGGSRAARAVLAACLLVAGCVDLNVNLPGAVVAVRVAPDTLVMRIGDSAFVRAAPLDSSQALRPQRPAVWTSSSPGSASVSAAGLVRALAAGVVTITATVDGISASATALISGDPANIAVSAGNGQTAPVNSTVAVAPAVIVTDAQGNPVARTEVVFAVASGGGAISPAGTVLTGNNGVAALDSWILGPSATTNTVTATAGASGVTGNPVTFTATATVGTPNAAQSAIVASPQVIAPSAGTSFATLTVTVRDSTGATISGATVSLAVSGTGNVLTQPVDTTNAQGQASGALTSSVAEIKTVTATVNGSVVLTQTATVEVSATAPAGLGVQLQPSGATSNVDFTVQPVVDVVDAFGNRVMTASGPITVTLQSGTGTLISSGGSFTVNAVNGRATFGGLRIRGTRVAGDTIGTGAHVLRFTAPGFNAVDSDVFDVAVSFAYNIVDVMNRNCAGCHTFHLYAQNVGAATSLSCLGRTRIIAGDTTNSFIYNKVRLATPACGVVMPTSGLMSSRQRLLIRDWIMQGAANN